MQISNFQAMNGEKNNKVCGNCLLCIKINLGGECSLTDNDVELNQETCVDHIMEEEEA